MIFSLQHYFSDELSIFVCPPNLSQSKTIDVIQMARSRTLERKRDREGEREEKYEEREKRHVNLG